MKIFYILLWILVGNLATTLTLNAATPECLTVKIANNAGYVLGVKLDHICEDGRDKGEDYVVITTALHAERQFVKGSKVELWMQAGLWNEATKLDGFQMQTPTWISCGGTIYNPNCDSGYGSKSNEKSTHPKAWLKKGMKPTKTKP